EHQPRRGLALDPEIDGRHPVPARDHLLGEIELPIELERARLHRERARGGARLGGLVDDADFDARLGKPQRKHAAGWSRADDQNFGLYHWLLPGDAPTEETARRVGGWIASKSEAI